jgi:hypothetical protein
MMTRTPEPMPADSSDAGRWISFIVAGTLLFAGSGGLLLNRVFAASAPEVAAADGADSLDGAGAVELSPATLEDAGPQAPPTPAVALPLAGRSGSALGALSVPPNPFRVTAAAPPAPAVSVEPEAESGSAPGAEVRPEVPNPAAPVVKARREPPANLVLVGIIQGEPPLAVFSLGGQSVYVKPGDNVNEDWRLQSVTDRSIILACEGQQVEITIQGGGSSQ